MMTLMRRSLRATVGGALLGAALLCAAGPSTAAPGAPPALADFLDANGRLQLPAGYSGALDPGGLRMQTATDGTPVFVPRDAPFASDKVFGISRGCNATPDAIAVLPSGKVVLGGIFTLCDDVPATSVVAYDPRTRRFETLGAGLTFEVPQVVAAAEALAFAVAGADLYVGGRFTHAGGVIANNIARWDGSVWHALGGGVDGRIRALAWSGTSLFAGGEFTHADGQPASRIARWDGQTWRALGSGANDWVIALAARGGEVYAGGFFTSIGGQAANHVARWDGSTWHALAEGTDRTVESLALLGGDLIAGGLFQFAGGQLISGIARWDGQAWSSIGALGGGGARASALAVVGNDLYAAGSFSVAGAASARNIARYRSGVWSALGTPGAEGIDASALSLAVAGNLVYVGGFFDEAGGIAADGGAVFNGNGWSPLGTDSPRGIEGRLSALLVDGDRLIAAGDFSRSGGLPTNDIAVWNGSAWFPFASGASVGGASPTSIEALAKYAGRVCAGGRFETAGGLPARNIACWDGSAWSALGNGADNGTSGTVLALLEHAGELYVAGSFASAGGVAAANIARWNGSRWAPLAGAGGDGVNGAVQAIAVHQGSLHVAGNFNQAGGGAALRIARWQDGAWTALGSGLGTARLDGEFPQQWVTSLASYAGRLYAGGSFIGGSGAFPLQYLAKWDGSAWSFLESGLTQSLNGSVRTLAVLDDGLYVGGQFTLAGGQPAPGLARWNDVSWRELQNPGFAFPLQADGQNLIAGAGTLRESPLATLQSRAAGGANAASSEVTVSRQRARIVFASAASNLVERDNDSLSDVFVRDPLSGSLSRVSDAAASLTGPLQEAYTEPAVSSDGAVVAFTGSFGQVYRVADGAARIVSSSAAGAPGNGASGAPQLAGPGSRVVFASQASNLLPQADGNGSVSDIYAKEFPRGAVALISAGPAGEPANGASYAPWPSDDGLAVAFVTRATNLVDGSANPGTHQQAVLLRTGERPARLYLSRNPLTGALGNGDTSEVRITPDGRFGVFTSSASNLVDDDTNGASDVFRFEVVDGQLRRLVRVSTSTYGLQANGASRHPSISDDGQFIAFESDASNLVPIDRGGHTDVFVKWLANGELQRLPRTPFDEPSNGHSSRPALSGDGLTVAFVSAGQLAVGDDNGAADAYAVDLRERGPGYFTGPLDEPTVAQLGSPGPDPANTGCPAGFFVAQAADGPGAGLTTGSFGMEVLLDEPGTRTLAGGLNFGGLVDSGQVGFAGFNIRNERNEPQRVDVRLAGSPASSSSASLPVRVRIARRTASSSETVFEASPAISLSAPFVGSVDVPPGFYEVTVGPLSGTVGGAPEGQFFFELTTRYLDRPGGGFEGGAVVGGYHAEHPFGGVSGFAAFCLATPHSASVRLLSQPSYGPAGARDLRLRVLDTQSREVLILPAE